MIPVISIIVPVYNSARFLWDCVKAIKFQTFKDWEAILVDDGSTDRSPEICDHMAEIDFRFRVIHKENGGVSSARNAGIEAARAKYLMFFDADDAAYPDYFEKMVNAAKQFDPDLLLCSYERFRSEWFQQYKFTKYSLVLMEDRKQFLMTYTESRVNMFGVSIWGKLYRTDIVKQYGIRFDPAISYEEDCDFNVSYLDHVNKIVALGDILYRYRQSDTSLSKAYRKDTFKFLVHGFHRRLDLMERNGLGEYKPNLEAILLLVIKATCYKILNSSLSEKEKLEEYRMLVSFPEAQQASCYQRKPKSDFTRMIAYAVRHKNARLLRQVMRLWKLTDQAQDKLHTLKYDVKDKLKNLKSKLTKREQAS